MSRRGDLRAAAERAAEARQSGVEDGLARVLRTLRALQEDIRLTLSGLPSEFDAGFLPELQREVSRSIVRWASAAEETAGSTWADAARRAGEMVTGPLRKAGIGIGDVVISDATVRALVDGSIDLIAGLSASAENGILDSITRGVLGGLSPSGVMAEIGEQLTDPGPFRAVRFRAEVIMRTETGRIHSVAGEIALQDAAKDVPDLGGEWLWSGKSRPAHAAANGQKRKLGEPFLVGGEHLLYPRQSGGSAANTICCGCEKIPWLARFET